jgi:hypothetical protein
VWWTRVLSRGAVCCGLLASVFHVDVIRFRVAVDVFAVIVSETGRLRAGGTTTSVRTSVSPPGSVVQGRVVILCPSPVVVLSPGV